MPPSLEEEIKQKKFKDPHMKGMINLIYTCGLIQSKQNKVFKRFGITLSQYNVLRILRGQHPKPATVSILIERMLDKTSNASRIVERLRKKEYVSRLRREEDRRQVDVAITDKGLELLAEIDSVQHELSCGFYSLTLEEITDFNTLLDKLRDSIGKGTCE